jgi:anaerobic selenocysteine-containing dehydrogenase
VIKWTGTAWGGNDVPDMRPDAAPDESVMPFIMTPEGVARLFAPAMADGPFPEHYEPFETPLDKNPFHPGNPRPSAIRRRGCSRATWKPSARPRTSPMWPPPTAWSSTSTYWTKHSMINAVLQPEQFVEISEELAKEKGIATGDKVKVRSNRGFIKAVAVVTKRIKTLDVDGKKVHTVGIPLHWGFKGVTKPGFITNTLTPFVGDANCADAGIQGVPGQHREDLREIRHGTAIARYRPPLGDDHPGTQRPADHGSGQADRRVHLHRLQGLPGGLHGMERHPRRGRQSTTASMTTRST